MRHVATIVQEVHVSEIKELRLLAPARRCTGVQKVCFYTPNSGSRMLIMEHGFASQLVPFLQSFGTGLKNVEFCDAARIKLMMALGIPEVEGGVFDPYEYARAIENIVRVLCDAFRGKVLSNENMIIEGTFCPLVHQGGRACRLCVGVLQSFPGADLLVIKPGSVNFTFEHILVQQDLAMWMFAPIRGRPDGHAILSTLQLAIANM
jgi:hypothetical protein